jgi:hypothetical protein
LIAAYVIEMERQSMALVDTLEATANEAAQTSKPARRRSSAG